MVEAKSLTIDGGREVGLPAVSTVVLLRLLLGAPVVQLLTRWHRELALCIGLGPPNWPSSSLRVERNRRLEICRGRLPEGRGLRQRLINGSCRLSVGGLKLLAYCGWPLVVRIMLGPFISRACRYCVDVSSLGEVLWWILSSPFLSIGTLVVAIFTLIYFCLATI